MPYRSPVCFLYAGQGKPLWSSNTCSAQHALYTTQTASTPGQRARLHLEWPAQLQQGCAQRWPGGGGGGVQRMLYTTHALLGNKLTCILSGLRNSSKDAPEDGLGGGKGHAVDGYHSRGQTALITVGCHAMTLPHQLMHHQGFSCSAPSAYYFYHICIEHNDNNAAMP